MSELYEQIQDAIVADDRPHGTRPSLLQILELHKPERYTYAVVGDAGDRFEHEAQRCVECSDYNLNDAAYPCDTVRLIIEAYGIAP